MSYHLDRRSATYSDQRNSIDDEHEELRATTKMYRQELDKQEGHRCSLALRFYPNPTPQQRIVSLIVKAKVSDANSKYVLAEIREQRQAERLQKSGDQFQDLWTPVICGAIESTFPREVRDIIYLELHNEFRSSYLYNSNIYSPRERGRYALSAQGIDILARPYFDEQVVGTIVAQEIAEAWYKHVVFRGDIFSALEMSEYLAHDRWGLGLQPYKLIRQISVTIPENSLSLLQMTRNLECLRGLGRRTSLKIVIDADESHDRRCLVCDEDEYEGMCGSFINYLTRSSRRLDRLVERLANLIQHLLPLMEADFQLSVSFDHISGPPVTLYEHGDEQLPTIELWHTKLKASKKVKHRPWYVDSC